MPLPKTCRPDSATRPRTSTCRVLVAVGVIAGTVACRDTLRAVGPDIVTAERHANDLFEGFAARFTDVELAPKYDVARVLLAKSALVPSRVFDDTSVWEARPSPAMRLLYISGGTVDGHYRLEPRPSLTPATRVGDTRHTIALERLEPNVYRWDTTVDLAVGSISADEMSKLLLALLRAPEGRSESETCADYRAAFPRASAAWGRGFAVDSLRVTPGTGGITTVDVTLGFHPDLMRVAFPDLAAYLDKYLGPAKYRLVLADRAGTPLLDIAGRDRELTFRYRLQQGALVTLAGPPRAWPTGDTLRLSSDMSLKVKLFTVGFHGLVTDFLMSNGGHEAGWTILARREPKWDLPLVTERLIRTALDRPFEGPGSMFRISLLDSTDGRPQTLLVRRTRLDVQESAIVRFLGSLGSHVVGDLGARVELQEDRFLREGFTALDADVHALAPSWRNRRDESEPAASPFAGRGMLRR